MNIELLLMNTTMTTKNIDNIENMSCCSIKTSLESNNLVRKWISEEPKIKC